jgi:hypothetical protein
MKFNISLHSYLKLYGKISIVGDVSLLLGGGELDDGLAEGLSALL